MYLRLSDDGITIYSLNTGELLASRLLQHCGIAHYCAAPGRTAVWFPDLSYIDLDRPGAGVQNFTHMPPGFAFHSSHLNFAVFSCRDKNRWAFYFIDTGNGIIVDNFPAVETASLSATSHAGAFFITLTNYATAKASMYIAVPPERPPACVPLTQAPTFSVVSARLLGEWPGVTTVYDTSRLVPGELHDDLRGPSAPMKLRGPMWLCGNDLWYLK